jgi:acetyltransferase-like isoleucine patch superfamily enzyme
MRSHLQIADAVYARGFRLLYARRFAAFGSATHVVFPAGIEGMENIRLGGDVYVARHSLLAAVAHTGSAGCLLQIGAGSRIGRFNHLYATRSVVLGAKVLTANGVYISDNLHGYRNPEVPIMDQPVVQAGPVEIGDGTWLGHNACVLGARIGRQCVIGANSVVTRDIPDHCVAVGAPAVIVKRYDPESATWRKTTPDGAFC